VHTGVARGAGENSMTRYLFIYFFLRQSLFVAQASLELIM
jgi:hypothetical protein